MRYLFILIFGFIFSFSAHSQYWYGPKIGGRMISTRYQRESVEDTFNVPNVYDFEAGVVVNYQANKLFSAQGELVYERVNKKLTDRSGEIGVLSKTTLHFLSAPFLLKLNMGDGPVHYYVNGGTKLSFWLGGNGTMALPELLEFPPREALEYKIIFDPRKKNGRDDRLVLPNANRVQYALVAGGGIFLDLRTGGRLMFDLRYCFGHSNMAFNKDSDFMNAWSSYKENFEYRNNTLTASVSYLFNYDMQLSKKGRSTIRESNRKVKK